MCEATACVPHEAACKPHTGDTLPIPRSCDFPEAWTENDILTTSVAFYGNRLCQARLAQSAERKALNLVVVGSSPTVGAFFPSLNGKDHRKSIPWRTWTSFSDGLNEQFDF